MGEEDVFGFLFADFGWCLLFVVFCWSLLVFVVFFWEKRHFWFVILCFRHMFVYWFPFIVSSVCFSIEERFFCLL